MTLLFLLKCGHSDLVLFDVGVVIFHVVVGLHGERYGPRMPELFIHSVNGILVALLDGLSAEFKGGRDEPRFGGPDFRDEVDGFRDFKLFKSRRENVPLSN